mmetsp:Transcript_22226/g.63046  ORF Transcript_22226/g.63046 Transcript_22226/m.63046 type:complete len:201 (-) Transcript_22226:337-939(-)
MLALCWSHARNTPTIDEWFCWLVSSFLCYYHYRYHDDHHRSANHPVVYPSDCVTLHHMCASNGVSSIRRKQMPQRMKDDVRRASFPYPTAEQACESNCSACNAVYRNNGWIEYQIYVGNDNGRKCKHVVHHQCQTNGPVFHFAHPGLQLRVMVDEARDASDFCQCSEQQFSLHAEVNPGHGVRNVCCQECLSQHCRRTFR